MIYVLTNFNFVSWFSIIYQILIQLVIKIKINKIIKKKKERLLLLMTYIIDKKTK